MRKISFLFIYGCIILSVLFAHNTDTLTFAQAAQLAVEASVDLRHSRASQAVMEGAWRWGLRAYFPQMSISVSENDRLQQLGVDSFMKNYGINIDQLIFDGGRTSMSRRLERMELNLSSARLDRMAAEIAEAAIGAYRNILSSRTILEIRNTALVVLEEQRRILNEEVLLGLALQIDLAGADINIINTKLDIYSLQLDLIEMEKQFCELLGLDVLPQLIETVDVNRPSIILARNTIPVSAASAALAREQNPDLVEARFSITKAQAQLRLASNSWVPTLRLNGNFGLSGQQYPLTRHNWSVGINIEFNSPWFQNRTSGQMGWEPPYDRTAMLQNSFTPLPDPAARYGRDQARLALALEREKYNTFLEQIGRIATNTVEKIIFAEQRRLIAIEAAAIGTERCRVEEVRLGLGHITRLNLMETFMEQTQREIAVVEAATALLQAERELERFLDLPPGELANFAANFTTNFDSISEPSQTRSEE